MKNISSTTMHLKRITQKEVPFVWTRKFVDIFKNLKTLLTTKPTITLLVESKNFIVYCDARHLGLGVVLI